MKSSLARNVASSWAVTAANVLYAVSITPVVVRALGTEQYGVWSFLSGLTGYSSLLYLGVGSALVKHVAAASASNDDSAINRFTSVGVTMFAGLGALSLVLFAAFSPAVPEAFANGLPEDVATSASIACALLGVQILCFFVTTGFMAALLGRDRFDLANLAQIGTVLLRWALVSSAIAGERPLVRLAVIVTASSVVELALVSALAYRVNRSLRVAPTWPQRQELQTLYGFGVPAFLINVSFRLISYTDTTVIGTIVGASSVAFYALPLQLVEYSRVVIAGYANVLLPRLTMLHVRGDREALQRAFLLNLRIASLIAAFVLTNLVWLGVPFLELWAGPRYGEPARWVIIWLAAAAFLHVFTTIAPMPFYQSMHVLGRPARVLVIEALLNLALSIVLAHRFGIEGVAAATLMPACLSFVLLSGVLPRRLNVATSTWVRSAMVPALTLAVCVSVCQWLMAGSMASPSFAALVLRTIGTVPAAAAVILASASRDERRALWSWLRTFGRTPAVERA